MAQQQQELTSEQHLIVAGKRLESAYKGIELAQIELDSARTNLISIVDQVERLSVNRAIEELQAKNEELESNGKKEEVK